MGMILVTASVAVFVWAVVGLIRPTWARLPSRAASVGVWVLSVVLFIIGGALMPDSTPEQTEQSAALGSQSVPPPTPEAAPAPDDGDWRTGRTTNALDDSPTVTAVLDAAQGVGGLLDSDPIQVIARCQSNKTEVYIRWHDFLGDDTPTDVYSEQKRVTYRFPPADATTELWGISTDNVAAFVAQPIPFLRTLVASDQLILQTTPYGESPSMATFELIGARAAIDPIAETCNWTLPTGE